MTSEAIPEQLLEQARGGNPAALGHSLEFGRDSQRRSSTKPLGSIYSHG
jgi:hypothetical protein